MNRLPLLGLLAACATSPEAPTSTAAFSAAPEVRTVRASPSSVFYGAPFHRWVFTLGTVEGCGGDAIADLELTTAASTTAIPVGTHPMRLVENQIAQVPSGYLRFAQSPIVSGSVTIDSATETFVNGSFAAQMTIGGTATEVTGMFSSPLCL